MKAFSPAAWSLALSPYDAIKREMGTIENRNSKRHGNLVLKLIKKPGIVQ